MAGIGISEVINRNLGAAQDYESQYVDQLVARKRQDDLLAKKQAREDELRRQQLQATAAGMGIDAPQGATRQDFLSKIAETKKAQLQDEVFDKDLNRLEVLDKISPALGEQFFDLKISERLKGQGFDTSPISDKKSRTKEFKNAQNELLKIARSNIPTGQKKKQLQAGLAQLSIDYPKLSTGKAGSAFRSDIGKTVPDVIQKPGVILGAIAKSMFDGKTFADLTADETAQVLKEEENRNIRMTGAKVSEKIRAEQEKKFLTGAELRNLIDTRTMSKLVYGTTAKEAAEIGATPASETQIRTLTDLDSAEGIVNELDELTSKLMVAGGPLEAAIQGGQLAFESFVKSNPDAAVYEGARAQFVGVLARTLGGERGVLTDRDISRITDGLPTLRDTKVIRDQKMAIVRRLLEIAKTSQLKVVMGIGNLKAKKEKEANKAKFDAIFESSSDTQPAAWVKGPDGVWRKQ